MNRDAGYGVTTSATRTATDSRTGSSRRAVPDKPSWWTKFWGTFDPPAKPWGHTPATDCGQEFGDFTERPFAELDMADSDVDGDTLLDGEDDQDNDDFNNITELYEAAYDLDGDGFRCVLRDDEGKIVSDETYPSVDTDSGPAGDSMGYQPLQPLRTRIRTRAPATSTSPSTKPSPPTEVPPLLQLAPAPSLSRVWAPCRSAS